MGGGAGALLLAGEPLAPDALLLLALGPRTAAEGQMGCVDTCFSVTLLYGAGFCKELDYTTDRPQPLCFGKMGGVERVPRVRANEEEGYSST